MQGKSAAGNLEGADDCSCVQVPGSHGRTSFSKFWQLAIRPKSGSLPQLQIPENIFPPRSLHPFPRNFDPPQCSSRISYGGGWHFTHWNRIGPVFARNLVAFWVKHFDGRFCVLSGIGRIWLFQSKCLFCTPICRGPENHSHIYCRISSQNLLCQERCLRGHNLPLWLPLWLALARPRPKAFLGCIKYCKIFSVFETHPALKWKIGSSIRETFCHWDQKV